MIELLQGDCFKIMPTLEENSIDTIITDVPYNLSFMNRAWDSIGGNHEYQEWTTDWATEALRVAKPGAMMLCFGGTRTFHRIACGIEDAGWEVRDCMAWIFGSGFPKSYNLGKKLPEWDGWGTALKPAWEYIGVFMKPREGTFVENALKWGCAGLNIDGGRVPTNDKMVAGGKQVTNKADERTGKALGMLQAGAPNTFVQNKEGRWPANVVHDGSEEVKRKFIYTDSVSNCNAYTNGVDNPARFFYTAKASKKERNAGECTNVHPCVKPISLMVYLARLTSTPTGGVVLDPFMGSGTTGMACKKTGRDFIGIELDEHYFEIAEKRIASVKQRELI